MSYSFACILPERELGVKIVVKFSDEMAKDNFSATFSDRAGIFYPGMVYQFGVKPVIGNVSPDRFGQGGEHCLSALAGNNFDFGNGADFRLAKSVCSRISRQFIGGDYGLLVG